MKFRVLIVALIFIVGIVISYFIINKPSKNHLKVFNPVDIKEELVDSIMRNKGYGHTIGKFSFKNQYNKLISNIDLKNKVFVAEYFFTTCGTICPIMNSQMKRVQEAYKTENNFKILSFTVDPAIDSVEQMNRYALAHGAIPNKWHFLTGEKKDLYHLARTSFFVLKPAETINSGDAGSDFIHTNNFVLVDKKGRIRGYYDGTSKKEVDHLIDDIKILLAE